MANFKIKLEDKAAFLNRLEKAGVALDTDQITDNKLEGYFEIVVDEPKQLEVAKTILKQSPKINTIKEMETKKKKLTKSELKEMVRLELQSVLAEKKKAKDEDKKEKIDEAVGGLDDPNFIAGVATLLGVSAAVLSPFIKALRSAKSPEEKAKVKSDLKKAIGSKMSGGM
jgi:hypothetical protein